MTVLLDAALIIIIFLGIILLESNRLGTVIQTFALQSFVLGLIPFILRPGTVDPYIILISLGTIIIKAFLMPYFLFWAIRHVSIRREVEPLIGYGTTLLLGGILIGGSFILASNLALPRPPPSDLLVPVAFSNLMIGFLLLVGRTKAITQVVGYLVVENGIFLFALLLLDNMPVLVEMGILLDIFVGVFIMGIVINHINEEFEQTNTLHLTTLRE